MDQITLVLLRCDAKGRRWWLLLNTQDEVVGGVIVTDAINKRATGTKAPLGMNFFVFCLQYVGDLGDVL